jgi:arylsulfatase A-like enzyme
VSDRRIAKALQEQRILVIGSTGRNGGSIIEALEAAGAKPRAMVRDLAKAKEKAGPGVQRDWVVGDLRDPPGQPFFCAAGLYKPHLPWHVPQRFFDMYPREGVVVPIIREDDLDDAPPLAKAWALSPPDHELITSKGVWKDAVQGYLACISYADEQVGKILAALESGRAADNTIIILCGDNGFHLGEKLHWRKFALWEEATRVPLIFSGPGIVPWRRNTEPVSLLDVYATILDAAGLPFDGRDACTLRSLMGGREGQVRPRSVIMTWGANNHSIRTSHWRLTRYVDGGVELFDHIH